MNTTEQMNRKELTEARTSNRKVFENQDHSRTVEIYLNPVHYQDTDGRRKEMVCGIVEWNLPFPSGKIYRIENRTPLRWAG